MGEDVPGQLGEVRGAINDAHQRVYDEVGGERLRPEVGGEGRRLADAVADDERPAVGLGEEGRTLFLTNQEEDALDAEAVGGVVEGAEQRAVQVALPECQYRHEVIGLDEVLGDPLLRAKPVGEAAHSGLATQPERAHEIGVAVSRRGDQSLDERLLLIGVAPQPIEGVEETESATAHPPIEVSQVWSDAVPRLGDQTLPLHHLIGVARSLDLAGAVLQLGGVGDQDRLHQSGGVGEDKEVQRVTVVARLILLIDRVDPDGGSAVGVEKRRTITGTEVDGEGTAGPVLATTADEDQQQGGE